MTIDNRQQLLNTINSQITLNGTGAITGPVLNNILDTMVNSALFYYGTWSAYTNYYPLDVVIYNGTSYTALSINVNLAPDTHPTVWVPFVVSSSSPGGVAGSVQYNSGVGGFSGASNFTFNGTTLTVPAISLTTALAVTQGGTGLTTLTGANRALYSTSSSALTAGTLPAAAGGTGLTSPGSSGNVLTSNGTAWVSGVGIPTPSVIGQIPFSTNGSSYTATPKITTATLQTAVGQSVFNFTTIPAWVKRITIMINGLSTSSTNPLLIQIGSEATYTGGLYNTASTYTNTSGVVGVAQSSTGFTLSLGGSGGGDVASCLRYGVLTLTSVGDGSWVGNGGLSSSNTYVCTFSGLGYLPATLDRLRITSSGDTFDLGAVNISYE